ncbi:penicillin amidase family protein, partial [Pseudomonas syringae pv. actinidiae ICMP 18807]
MSRALPCFLFAGLSVAVVLPAQALVAHEQKAAGAEIRRTGFGVPHIVADDERGLGYGIGYAYAQDNLCLLANEIVTVNGERSRYLGP